VVASFPPVTVPNPAGPNQPPLLYVGPLIVYQTGPTDPVQAIQQCLAQGGPRISFDNGGC
jgi:hypothetical protein